MMREIASTGGKHCRAQTTPVETMTAKPRQKKARKPKPSVAPAGPPLPVSQITRSHAPLVMPRHVGAGVDLESLPREAWPAPSPVELATVAGACGFAGQTNAAARAMALLWECAEVIHETRESASLFLESIRLKNEWTTAELRKACGFDYQKLPDRITHADFLSRFNKERLKVNGRVMRGRDLFDHWLTLPEGAGVPVKDVEAWHARHKGGFEYVGFTFSNRWEVFALWVARFNEWRRNTARKNNPGEKNLKRGENFPC
jgi:hypothetical protein